VGEQITVTMDVNNTGLVDIINIVPSALTPSDLAAVTIASTPVAPMNLSAGTGGTFTWVYNVVAVSAGLTFTGNAGGQNALTLAAVSSAASSNTPFNCQMPTATVTQTGTAVPVNTATRTATPTPTATRTPVAVPTSPVLAFADKEASVKAYPNPVVLNASGAQPPVSFDFSLSRAEAGAELTLKIYTTSARCVRTFTRKDVTVNGVPNGSLAVRNIVAVQGTEMEGLSQGIYYCIVIVSDNTAKNVRSKIEKLIIFRK
jgi:hypothetical protein